MGIVLVDRVVVEQPDPGAQLGLDVDDPLASPDELLSQEVAQAGGVLDRPGPRREPLGPGEQPLELSGPRAHSDFGQGLLGLVDRHGGVRSLVSVDTDHHRHDRSFVVREVGRGRHV